MGFEGAAWRSWRRSLAGASDGRRPARTAGSQGASGALPAGGNEVKREKDGGGCERPSGRWGAGGHPPGPEATPLRPQRCGMTQQLPSLGLWHLHSVSSRLKAWVPNSAVPKEAFRNFPVATLYLPGPLLTASYSQPHEPTKESLLFLFLPLQFRSCCPLCTENVRQHPEPHGACRPPPLPRCPEAPLPVPMHTWQPVMFVLHGVNDTLAATHCSRQP